VRVGLEGGEHGRGRPMEHTHQPTSSNSASRELGAGQRKRLRASERFLSDLWRFTPTPGYQPYPNKDCLVFCSPDG
jgi:hypothetical protein